LTAAAVELARNRGMRTLYLLTETAAGFFDRLGFDRIERTELPQTIRRSDQFTRVCPETAVAMHLHLG
jgi:amino-acid N-acetyltransferase